MNSVFEPAVRPQAVSLSAALYRTVKEFFQDEQHRKDFEVWYEATYGEPYQWKQRADD